MRMELTRIKDTENADVRRVAKIVNFAPMYGANLKCIMKQLEELDPKPLDVLEAISFVSLAALERRAALQELAEREMEERDQQLTGRCATGYTLATLYLAQLLNATTSKAFEVYTDSELGA